MEVSNYAIGRELMSSEAKTKHLQTHFFFLSLSTVKDESLYVISRRGIGLGDVVSLSSICAVSLRLLFKRFFIFLLKKKEK
jgi:hypothetical protein